MSAPERADSPEINIGLDTVPSLDLYRELEVDPAATPETIEAAWRSLVKRHHPDIAADRAAAIEKIKRINLAHEWLSDRALRSAYDMTRLRQRHPDLGIEPPVRPAHPPPPIYATRRDGRRGLSTSPPSTIISASIVAVLLVGALVTVALGPNRGTPPVNGVAEATGRSPTASVLASLLAGGGGVGGGASEPSPSEPAFAGDLPAECASSPGLGQPFRFELPIDGQRGYIYYAKCGQDRTFGPLAYVERPTGWERRTAGKLERAVPKLVIPGSMTGEANEYVLVWTAGDGVDSWMVVYRVEAAQLRSVWSSLAAGIPRWGLAEYSYSPNASQTGGSISVRFADMDTGTCRTCPDHEIYVETYEWNPDQETMERSFRAHEGRGEP